MPRQLKKYLSFGFLVLFVCSLAAQDFDCELIFWEAVKDTIDQDGDPAILMRLSTESNPINTGYTTFMLLNEQGDTIVEQTTPSFFLPAKATIGDPVKEYLLKLKPPFVQIGSDFKGCLITTLPICSFKLEVRLSVEEFDPLDTESIKIYPNPFSENINILSSSQEREVLEIYNTCGIHLHTQTLYGEEQLSIETSDWPSGFYFIKTKREILKFVKL